MFLKYIVCTIKPENKNAFSEAQNLWYRTKEAKGFIAQIGGWNTKKQNEAVILSFWEDKSSLDNFMVNLHDTIFKNNKQLNTYETITVSLYNVEDLGNKKQSFKNNIDKVKMIETFKTNHQLAVEFKGNSICIKGSSLANKKVNLVESWKVL